MLLDMHKAAQKLVIMIRPTLAPPKKQHSEARSASSIVFIFVDLVMICQEGGTVSQFWFLLGRAK